MTDAPAGGGALDAARPVLQAVRVSTARVSEMDNACYLLTCTATGAQLLVDAADDAPRLLDLAGGRLDAVVTTHGHRDHHRALPEVVRATGAQVLVGEPDAGDLPVPPDRVLRHGDVVEVGDLRLDVVGLRGHTPGSVALVLHDPSGRVLVLTGDSLFPGGVGATGGDAARFARLLDDVVERLFSVLPDRAEVLPGHGEPTTLGAERPHLAAWRERGW
ncbi:MBL fold metallo-hydrolase [Pseudokineococcus basanitobsidens]|uniref:MBL fold metallo-hydrolase n=1 Tax=Pseudokineococcus basanitobsidens TaxID=1926649 RepID=A0ABU8RIC4_9ACTN